MKTTLEYLKDRYSEEQSRFDHFENKCAKLLTFASVVIGAITAIAGTNKGIVFHPESPAGWIILIAFLIGSFSISCAWGHSLLALRIGECPVLPRSRVAAEYITAVDIETQSTYLYNCYIGTLEQLAEVIDEKSKNLELAYQELAISAWGLAVAASLTIYMEITK
ncbi:MULTISPECIES: hypothetical protein [unclassified Pseudomonas]|uniref:hypothetical protein n=1 Tax=unclassified Pseudomonas TaxID=196821 RepID=UPI000D731380|nr:MULTISPECIES: hypothetical protein [unclassified Pseudomonas]PWY37830.1 hypothetical protein DK261_23555 [Pseudomonas sp. RW409]